MREWITWVGVLVEYVTVGGFLLQFPGYGYVRVGSVLKGGGMAKRELPRKVENRDIHSMDKNDGDDFLILYTIVRYGVKNNPDSPMPPP